jgi:hypothetical protein
MRDGCCCRYGPWLVSTDRYRRGPSWITAGHLRRRMGRKPDWCLSVPPSRMRPSRARCISCRTCQPFGDQASALDPLGSKNCAGTWKVGDQHLWPRSDQAPVVEATHALRPHRVHGNHGSRSKSIRRKAPPVPLPAEDRYLSSVNQVETAVKLRGSPHRDPPLRMASSRRR